MKIIIYRLPSREWICRKGEDLQSLVDKGNNERTFGGTHSDAPMFVSLNDGGSISVLLFSVG